MIGNFKKNEAVDSFYVEIVQFGKGFGIVLGLQSVQEYFSGIFSDIIDDEKMTKMLQLPPEPRLCSGQYNSKQATKGQIIKRYIPKPCHAREGGGKDYFGQPLRSPW